MFKKVLVANRGEIAVRIIRALKELDIKSVAVYSEADKDSLHVELADEAICIGPARSDKSYLSIPAIISAAEISGADAIHPGYGFLAENDTFVEICEDHGIVFIGPSAKVMRLMSNKKAAKKEMAAAGLPVVPEIEIDKADKNIDDLDIEFPVLIKASYGGGGRGIRRANNSDELKELIQSASAEAAASFGSGEIYIEKLIEKPRHIEFQVIADKHGNVKVLGERDCSLQRRHQKIIEEALSPALDDKKRQEMYGLIEKAVREIGYYNASTFEFLMDSDGNLYFMEINTRLQVEHPVTEEVFDVDIVREQILVAAGEKLSDEVLNAEPEGHAIEYRVTAEDPETFMPSPGKINRLRFPGGPGVRLDSHIYEGYTVPPFYDSLIAKLIVKARTRREAIKRGNRALGEFIIEGISTNIPFLLKLNRSKEFEDYLYDTGYVERIMELNEKF